MSADKTVDSIYHIDNDLGHFLFMVVLLLVNILSKTDKSVGQSAGPIYSFPATCVLLASI